MIYFEALGQMFDFGKFKGCDLGEVLMCSPDYVQWVMENVNGDRCAFSDEAIKQIRTIFPNFVITNELKSKIKNRSIVQSTMTKIPMRDITALMHKMRWDIMMMKLILFSMEIRPHIGHRLGRVLISNEINYNTSSFI